MAKDRSYRREHGRGAAGIVVATLAATHRTAVRENFAAYLHGWHDALEAVREGLDPFDSFDGLDA